MKHKLTFFAVLLMTALTLSAVAQNKQRTPPNRAKYKITGTMNYYNGHRYLENAKGEGIYFEYENSRMARPTDTADLEVKFEYAKTDHPGGFNVPLDFWRYDDEIGEWVYDSEVRQGHAETETRLQTNLMLVIDNSKSLGADFVKVQDAAKEFVNQLYTASREKKVTFRVGVIGFSTIKFTKIREITPLDADNYSKIISFIESLSPENGTAFYYSLDTALTMLEDDALILYRQGIFRDSRIYAFTDGLDQASINDKRGLTTPQKYFDELRPKMHRPICGKKVRSTIVTVKGGDMTEKQVVLFDERAQNLCDDVNKLKDMTQLMAKFRELAEELVNSNYILKCYIPEGASGLVGWTFADENYVSCAPKSPKQSVKMWLGMGLEGGLAFMPYKKYSYSGWYTGYELSESGSEKHPFGGVKFDLALAFSPSFALGFSGSFTFCSEGAGYGIGALTVFTRKDNSAVLAGAGVKNVVGNTHPYVSLGWKFRSPWYINAFAAFNGGVGELGIGVGYNILDGKLKK